MQGKSWGIKGSEGEGKRIGAKGGEIQVREKERRIVSV